MGVDEARTKYALKWEALRERVQASRTYDLLARCLEIHFTISINNNNNNRKTYFLMCLRDFRVYANPVFKLSWFPLLTLPLLLLDHTDERKWRTAWVAGVMGLVSLFFFFFSS